MFKLRGLVESVVLEVFEVVVVLSGVFGRFCGDSGTGFRGFGRVVFFRSIGFIVWCSFVLGDII